MVGRSILSVVIVLLIAFFLSEAFPGRRVAPVSPAIATMEWHGTASAAPFSFDEPTSLAACREMQRQLAHRQDGDSDISLACEHPRAPERPL
jgi:hypothetical protein